MHPALAHPLCERGARNGQARALEDRLLPQLPRVVHVEGCFGDHEA